MPVGPSPTSMGAPTRAPVASTATTLFEPIPVMYARPPSARQAMPLGSPTARSRSAWGTLLVE